MLQEIYDLLFTSFFSGVSVPALAGCATELCSLLSIALMALAILIPIFMVFGFIRWIWYLFR